MFWEERASFAKAFRCSSNSKETNMPGTEHLKIEQREMGRSKIIEGAMAIVSSEALTKMGPKFGFEQTNVGI